MVKFCFFRLSLAFVEFAGELLQVHVGGIGPWAEEVSAEYSLIFVEDDGLGAKVLQHRLRPILSKTNVVHLEFGEILGVGATIAATLKRSTAWSR